jgi:hypothetical protein
MRLATSFFHRVQKIKAGRSGIFSPVARLFINSYYFSRVFPDRTRRMKKRAGRECSERPDSFFKPVFPALR